MSTEIHDFTELTVWQVANKIRKDVYKLTEKFPASEKYNLIPQLRRAATSIAANIAEGFGRYHYQENIQFCRQARGSLEEVRDGIIFANEMAFTPQKECQMLLEKLIECRQLLNGYIRSLNKSKSQTLNP